MRLSVYIGPFETFETFKQCQFLQSCFKMFLKLHMQTITASGLKAVIQSSQTHNVIYTENLN